MSATTRAAQLATLAAATNHGAHWTQDEIDAMNRLTAEGLTTQQVALRLGRSLSAVWQRRYAGSDEGRDRRQPVAIADRTPTFVPQVVLPHDRGYVDLDALFAGD